MATKEFLQKRIEGKIAEIAKLDRKIERIEKAKATGWEINPYYYREDDLKWALRDKENAEKSLADYKAELEKTIEKDNSRDIKVILDFLDSWKEKTFTFYNKALTEYYAESERVNKMYRDLFNEYGYGYRIPEEEKKKYEDARHALYNKINGYYEERQGVNRWGKTVTTTVKVKDGEWEFIRPYINRGGYDDAVRYLKKELDEEAKRKYDYLIERVNAICGTIVDASNLVVSENGELNGIIEGNRGTASVKTIGAGGYNIQCFHFRLLVHKVK